MEQPRFGRIETYLSVMADAWFLALTPHLSSLLRQRRRPKESDRWQVNADAAATCLLSVLLLESLARRAAYMIDEAVPITSRIIRRAPKPLSPERSAVDIIDRLIGECRTSNVTAQEVEEVFVVRDCLVHDHLWEVTLAELEHSEGVVVTRAAGAAPFGDKKYRSAVDGQTTRVLGVAVIPTEITREDAGKVLNVVARCIDLLKHTPTASVDDGAFWLGVSGRRLTLAEVAERLLRPASPT